MVVLKTSLTGPPQRLVRNLGYTSAQYRLAVLKLESKYGGEECVAQRHIEDILLTPRITDGDVKALEDFSDQLEDSVIKLAHANSPELCGRSTLHVAAVQ